MLLPIEACCCFLLLLLVYVAVVPAFVCSFVPIPVAGMVVKPVFLLLLVPAAVSDVCCCCWCLLLLLLRLLAISSPSYECVFFCYHYAAAYARRIRIDHHEILGVSRAELN